MLAKISRLCNRVVQRTQRGKAATKYIHRRDRGDRGEIRNKQQNGYVKTKTEL